MIITNKQTNNNKQTTHRDRERSKQPTPPPCIYYVRIRENEIDVNRAVPLNESERERDILQRGQNTFFF